MIANELIERAFENVLQNAVGHNDEETHRVTVYLEVDPETATIHVKDNGPGIPEIRRSQIFDPELDREHRFGLYLVKSLITQYDGRVEITENDPEGTVISITLPRTDRGEQSTSSLGLVPRRFPPMRFLY